MNERTRERASQLFFALSNPSRLRITELLCHAEMSVNEICAALSLGQSATSQNLAALTRAGILAVEQKGTTRIYRVRGPRIAHILALIEEFCRCMNSMAFLKRQRPGRRKPRDCSSSLYGKGGQILGRANRGNYRAVPKPMAVPGTKGDCSAGSTCHPKAGHLGSFASAGEE